MDSLATGITLFVLGLVALALALSQHDRLLTWANSPSGSTALEVLGGKFISLVVGWAVASLIFFLNAWMRSKKAVGKSPASVTWEPSTPAPASARPGGNTPDARRPEAGDGAEFQELLGTISECLDSHASRKVPFSELADAGGAILLLVLCSAPAAAYRLSYVLPYDRFKVAVLDSLQRCLQFLDELPYLPDCVVVEVDDLAGGAEAATKTITAIRKRASAAELPVLRVIRNGGLRIAQGSASSRSAAVAQQQQQMVPLAIETLVAPFDPADLDARVTGQVALRRLHQQRAAAHATLTVLRYILPPPAFADLTYGTPWATRVHADVSVLTAVLVDPHATAGVAAAAPVVQSPVSLMAAMHDAHAAFDGLCVMHGVTKMSTLGHEYIAVGGLAGCLDHLERLMRVAAGMVSALVEQQHAQIQAGMGPLEVQIGLHTGACVAGVVGRTRPAYTLLGDVMVVANQLRATSHPMCVHVSSTVRDRLQPAAADGPASTCEFSFVAATSRTVGGGPSGLGPARTYFAKLGHWRAALAVHGGAGASTGIASGISRVQGPAVPGARQVRRSTHSGRAFMAVAAAAGAAAAAAGAGTGADEAQLGKQRRQPTKAQSASSVETSWNSSMLPQQQHQLKESWQSMPVPGPYDAIPLTVVGVMPGNWAATGAANAAVFSAVDEAIASVRSSPIDESDGTSLGTGGMSLREFAPQLTRPGAAAAAAEYGAVAAAIATKNPQGSPRRSPPGRVYSNLSNSTSLFASSTAYSGMSSSVQHCYWQTHGSSGAFGACTASNGATGGAMSSGSSLCRSTGLDGQLPFRDASNTTYRASSTGPLQSAIPTPPGALTPGSQYLISLLQQQQQPQTHGSLQGPSAALPTVDEDFGISGPGGVSGSLGGFTAALYNLSNGMSSNAQLHSSAITTGRSTGPMLMSVSAPEPPLGTAAGVPSLAATESQSHLKVSKAQAVRRSESSAMQASSGTAGTTASGAGISGGVVTDDILAMRRMSGIGAEHNPYMIYTNISDIAGGGSTTGLGARGSGFGCGAPAGGSVAASRGGGDISGAPSEPTPQGITHSELIFLLATSSAGLPVPGGGGCAGEKGLMTDSYDDVQSVGPRGGTSGDNVIVATPASMDESRPDAVADTAAAAAASVLAAAMAVGDETLPAGEKTGRSDGCGREVTVSVSVGGVSVNAAAAATSADDASRGASSSSPQAPVCSLTAVPLSSGDSTAVPAPASISAAEAVFTGTFGASAGSVGGSPSLPLPAPKVLRRSGKAVTAIAVAAAAAATGDGGGYSAVRASSSSTSSTSNCGISQLLGPAEGSQTGLLDSRVKVPSSVDGGLAAGTAFPTAAAVGASELAMLLQVAQRSVGGNSGSSISFPHLQELVSATLRDAGAGRAPGSSVSANSFNLQNGYLQLLNVSNENQQFSSSQDCLDTETPASTSRGMAGGGAGGGGGVCSSITAAAPAAAAVAGVVRRRSVDMQRALATAAAAGAVAAAAGTGTLTSGGSAGSGSAGASPNVANSQPRALQRLCRTFQQLYNHQCHVQQQQQQQQQTLTQQQRQLLLMQQQQQVQGQQNSDDDLRPWILTEISLTGSDNSTTINTSDGRVMRSMSAIALPVTSTAAGALLSGTSGIGSDGFNGSRRSGDGAGSSGSGRQRALLLADATPARARPAAGHLGIPSALSTVPDLPTPPTSSCYDPSQENSRNPLTSQQLPSSFSIFTSNTGALSALLLHHQPVAAVPMTGAQSLLAVNNSSSVTSAEHASTHDGYYHHNQGHLERRVTASPLSRVEVYNNSPLVFLLGTGGSMTGTNGLESMSPVDVLTRTNVHIGASNTAVAVSAEGCTTELVAVPAAPGQYGGGQLSGQSQLIRSDVAASSNGEGSAASAAEGGVAPPGLPSNGGGCDASPAGVTPAMVVPAMLLTSMGGDGASYGVDGAMLRTENSSAAVCDSSTLLSTHQSIGAAGVGGSGSPVTTAGGERRGSREVWSGSVGVGGGTERLMNERTDGTGHGGGGGADGGSAPQSTRRSVANVAAAFFFKRNRHHHQRASQSQSYTHNAVMSSEGALSAAVELSGRMQRRTGSSEGLNANISAASIGISGAFLDDPQDRTLGRSGLGGSGGPLAGLLRTLSFAKYQKRSSSKNIRT